MSAKILTFPDVRPSEDLPGWTDAEQLVARVGPAHAARIAEYVLINAVRDVKVRENHKAVPMPIAHSGIDTMMEVRKFADMLDRYLAAPETFRDAPAKRGTSTK